MRTSNGPQKLLNAALHYLPKERREWGAAMRAELAQLQNPHTRWQFALGCACVALFPPRRGGFLMNDRMKYWLTTFGVAALFSSLLSGTFMFLSLFSDKPELPSGNVSFPWLDFFRSWLTLTFIFTPIVSGLRTSQSTSMKHWLIPLGTAILFGLLLMAPFALMEWSNNPSIQSGEFQFPFTLFFVLWLMPTLLFLGATPIVRGLRAGEPVLAHPLLLLLRVGLLAFVALGWVNLLRDQMPCFLGGVPGCD